MQALPTLSALALAICTAAGLPAAAQNVAAQLAYYRELRYIPVVTITGHELPAQFLSIGDRFFLDLTARPYTDNILGWYRLERMEVDVDDNDFESSIRLYFDNNFVDPETGESV